MKLKPLDSAELIELAAGWLAQKENYQWLDFGGRIATPAALKIMTQMETHVLRVFTADEGDVPIGVVGLNNVDRNFKTATAWVVLGDKSYARRGCATRALSKMLTLAFRELRLRAVNTWVVEHNPSIRVVERTNFRFIGRQRQCHCIDGRTFDRLLFDLLASEHWETLRGASTSWVADPQRANDATPAWHLRGSSRGQRDHRLGREPADHRMRRNSPEVKLRPIDTPELIDIVAGWMARKHNYQWMDFGNGRQIITPISLKMMMQRDIHVLQVFTSEPDDVPIGVVGLSNVDRNLRTASIWVVLGNKRYGGCTIRALDKILTFGFGELGIRAVSAWTVETNSPSLRLLDQLNFRFIGRQRQCHYIDGRLFDRLLFDILDSEHKEV